MRPPPGPVAWLETGGRKLRNSLLTRLFASNGLRMRSPLPTFEFTFTFAFTWRFKNCAIGQAGGGERRRFSWAEVVATE